MTRENEVPPARPRRRRSWRFSLTDAAWTGAGLALCAGAIFFPWHVYKNPDRYGPPEMRFSRDGEVPGDEVLALASGNAVMDFATGKFVMADASVGGMPGIDRLTTGRVDRDADITDSTGQPFPSNGAVFRVFAVGTARALVGDSDGIYLVGPNSYLPDGTIVRTIGRDEDGGYIETSADRMLRPE